MSRAATSCHAFKAVMLDLLSRIVPLPVLETQAVLETVTSSEHILSNRSWVPIGPESGGRLVKGNKMTRVSLFSSPFLLGFDDFERLVERAVEIRWRRLPPYNIERFAATKITANICASRWRLPASAARNLKSRLRRTNSLFVDANRMTRPARTCIAALPPANSSAPSCWRTAWRSGMQNFKTGC